MRVLTIAAVCSVCSVLAMTPAQAASITFDGFSPQTVCLDPLTTEGMSFAPGTSICVGVWPDNPVSSNGTPGLIYGYGSMEMSAVGGGSFFLDSFLAGISWYSALTTATIDYLFDLPGGGTAAGSFQIGQGLALYNFDQSVTKATFSGLADGYVAIDNLSVSVPEPGTLALLGLGLAGLAATRRRKQ